MPNSTKAQVLVLCAVAGTIFGYFGLEYITVRPFTWVERQLRQVPLPALAAAIIGLTVALILAILGGYFLRGLGNGLNYIAAAALALLLGYWGVSVGLRRYEELLALLRGQPLIRATRTLLDTSAIIDGRVVDVARAGFLEGVVIAPHFVLAELQYVADSADAIRRGRGRRGLEMLEELRAMPGLRVEFSEDDYPGVPEVDHKLIRMAKAVDGSILTTDYNLNKVAQLEGVRVRNINDLANALKPAVIPGEELTVTLLKEGKGAHQAVAYLADGTMVVVEGGRGSIGQEARVVVTSVTQTAMGRMIFAAVGRSLDRRPEAPPGADVDPRTVERQRRTGTGS